MNVDTSNSNDPAKANHDKPIMKLLRTLITSDSKNNTVLTNASILSILKDEFNITINNLTDLEVDIYLNVMKKFLKEWPMWDEFDNIVGNSNARGHKEIENILQSKYSHLRNYLNSKLELAKPIAKNALKAIKPVPTKKDVNDKKNVFIEVQCTRNQLDNLIYTQPVTIGGVLTILNVKDTIPNSIKLMRYTFQSVLRTGHIKLIAMLPGYIYRRESTYKQKFSLVNTSLPEVAVAPEMHNTKLQRHNSPSKTVAKDIFIKKLIMASGIPKMKNIMKLITEIIKEDVKTLNTIHMGRYRQYLSKYDYIQYLSSKGDTGVTHTQYNLQLRETTTPIMEFSFAHTDTALRAYNYDDWLRIECTQCNIVFQGADCINSVVNHFTIQHIMTGVYSCPVCKIYFTYSDLLESNWHHECVQ